MPCTASLQQAKIISKQSQNHFVFRQFKAYEEMQEKDLHAHSLKYRVLCMSLTKSDKANVSEYNSSFLIADIKLVFS